MSSVGVASPTPNIATYTIVPDRSRLHFITNSLPGNHLSLFIPTQQIYSPEIYSLVPQLLNRHEFQERHRVGDIAKVTRFFNHHLIALNTLICLHMCC